MDAHIEAATRPGELVLFETILVPHRSLPPLGFLLVMGVLIGVSVIIGVGFTLLGAWPVMGFFGLDILLVYVVFRMSYGTARRAEQITLTARDLTVSYMDEAGRTTRATFQPYWARVALEPVNSRRNRLVLRSHGQSVELGAFLGPDEKAALADSLSSALESLRRGPVD